MNRLFFLLLFLTNSLLLAGKEQNTLPGFQTGVWLSAEIRLNYESDFRLVIPGAADPVRRGRSAHLVFLGNLRMDRLDARGLPEILTLRPVSVSGTVNGRNLDSAEMANKEIRVRLAAGKAVFTFADGTLISGKSEQALAFLFRRSEFLAFSDLLGKDLKTFRKGEKRYLSPESVYRELHRRNLNTAGVKLTSVLSNEGNVSIRKIPCRIFHLNLQTDEPKDIDLRYRLKVTFPKAPARKNILRTEYQGVEVLTDKLKVADPMASGAAIRLITTESADVLLMPGVPEKKKESSFLDAFR